MKVETIHLRKAAIAFRDDAIAIKKLAKKTPLKKSDFNIDFKEVQFISRGFADELFNTIESLKKSGITLHLKNTAPNIRKMLALVQASRRSIFSQTGSPIIN